jgi:hypothetical protein
MHSPIEQIEPETWPSGYGDVVAVLDIPLAELAELHALQPYEGSDNLGYYRAVALRLPSGRRIGLLHHAGVPDGDTEVHADARDDPADVLDEVIRTLGMAPTACSWLRPTNPA